MSTERARRAALATALVTMLSGCFSTDSAPDDGSSEPPVEVPETITGDGVCEWLGFEDLDNLGAEFGYEPTLEEYDEDGGCSKRLGRMVDDSERETIVLGAIAYEFNSAQSAAAAYQDWISNGDHLSLAFPDNAQEFEVSDAWDEGTIAANLEWSDGPQLRMLARADRFLVTYRAMLSVKGGVDECDTTGGSNCAIGPAIVLDWFAESWTPHAAEQLVAEVPSD